MRHLAMTRARQRAHPEATAIWMPVLAAIFAAYVWWMSGVRAFSALSYAAVGIGAGATLLFYALKRASHVHPGTVSSRSPLKWSWALPWLGILISGAALEAIGLALGGRSNQVPTLSTLVDELLANRAIRALAIGSWLGVALLGAARLEKRAKR